MHIAVRFIFFHFSVCKLKENRDYRKYFQYRRWEMWICICPSKSLFSFRKKCRYTDMESTPWTFCNKTPNWMTKG